MRGPDQVPERRLCGRAGPRAVQRPAPLVILCSGGGPPLWATFVGCCGSILKRERGCRGGRCRNDPDSLTVGMGGLPDHQERLVRRTHARQRRRRRRRQRRTNAVHGLGRETISPPFLCFRTFGTEVRYGRCTLRPPAHTHTRTLLSSRCRSPPLHLSPRTLSPRSVALFVHRPPSSCAVTLSSCAVGSTFRCGA